MGQIGQLQQIGLGFDALSAVNSGVSAVGQIESGHEQQAAYAYNASVVQEQARQKNQTAEATYTNLIGRQASAYAAAGVDIASGSPLLVMAHTAAQKGAEEASTTEAASEQSALDKYYGKVAAFQGTVGGISTFISGLTKAGPSAATLLT